MNDRISLTAILLVFAVGAGLCAQDKGTGSDQTNNQVPDAPPAIDVKEVEKEVADVEKSSTLDETKKKALKDKFRLVLDITKEADGLKKNASDFSKAIEESPKKALEYQEALSGLPSAAEAADVGSRYSFDSLRGELDKANLLFQSKTKELNAQSVKLQALETRAVEIISRLPEARKILQDSKAAWEKFEKSEKTLTTDDKAERWLNQAKWLRAANEIAMLQAEQLSRRQREEELTAHVALLNREVENANARVKSLGRLLSEEISSDVERFRSIANEAMEAMPSDLDVQSLGEEVLELANNLATVSVNANALTAKGLQMKLRISELDNDYQSIREELRLGSSGIEMAQVLIELGRRLGGVPARGDDMMSVEQARLIWFDARKKDRRHEELEKQFENYPQNVKQLVECHAEVLDRLKVESNDLTADLSDLQQVLQNYLKLRSEIQDFVTQKLFGFEIRSNPSISLKSFTETPAGLIWLFSLDHLQELGHEFDLKEYLVSIVFFLSILLIILRPFFNHRLQKLNNQTLRISTDHIGLTTRGVFCSIALAAPVPLIWFLLVWVLSHSSVEYQWMVGLQFVVTQLFAFVIMNMIFREISRKSGIGVAHFKWSTSSAAALRSRLYWIFSTYLPLMLISSCFAYGEGSEYFSSTGRIAFILAHLGILGAFNPLRYLRRRRVESHNSESMDSQTRWLRAVAITVIFSATILVFLACIGFLMTALYISVLLATTGAILMVSRLAYCFVHRWLQIRSRKLAFAEAMLERQAMREAEQEEEDESRNVQEDLGIDEEEELKLCLEEAGLQSERLLRLGFNVATAVAVYIYWSTVFPLSGMLDKYSVPLIPSMSLFQLAKACLVIFVSIVSIRNLPGLIELVLLSHSKVEIGTRKAIHTLGQYGVCAVAIVALSSILEWDWSKLGWLAAALSVGLGFGLQEIVANFVCGIILLFERPIRIGDVVSLGGNTGVVTKIHLRATIITDWDRQEIVVPNKNLITGTIFNWTLSAKLNRVVVLLGVALGTDTEKATEIMLKVAEEHPDVIDDPPPTAHFTGFGDGALNLVLRAFLADRDNRENAITTLHAEINRQFELAGIKLALPRRQLQLSVDLND